MYTEAYKASGLVDFCIEKESELYYLLDDAETARRELVTLKGEYDLLLEDSGDEYSETVELANPPPTPVRSVSSLFFLFSLSCLKPPY